MDIKSVVRAAMEEQGVTYEAMSARVGTSRSSVGNALGAKQRSLGVEKALVFLSALNMELVVVPRGTRLPQGAVVVTRTADEV